MKRHLVVLGFLVGWMNAGFAQSGPPNARRIESRIAALEQAGWTAWKNKDKRWYLENTVADAACINGDGVTDKGRFLKDLATDCDVVGFALGDHQITAQTSDLVIMTYTATQDAVCGGKKLPDRIRASVVYVKRGTRWLEALYMETPLARP